MTELISDIAFSPSVKAEQEKRGSRAGYAKMAEKRDWANRVTPDLAAYIAERDSFYMASVNADGQPYIQHRGGPKGFLKALDDRTLAFADFSGNRQYITLGNLADNNKVALFLMDYANRQRIKIWGRARYVEGDDALMARLAHPDYPAQPERAVVIEITAWGINCPQHITPRYAEEDVREAIEKLQDRILELEAEVKALRAKIYIE